MKKIAWPLLMLLFVISACTHSPIPNSKTYVKSEQQLMQATHHWKLYAGFEAEKIAGTISDDEIYYIDMPDKSTPFENALNYLLTSQMLSHGQKVVIDSALSTVNLSYHVQVISHNKQGVATMSPLDIDDTFRGRETTEEKVEVLITTQAVKNRQIILSDSQVYYFYPANDRNYKKQKPLKPFDVTDAR